MNQPREGVVNIRGKEYKTVALRVHEFTESFDEHACSIFTDIIKLDEICAVVKATIVDPTGRVMATGHAEEFRGSGPVNRTSALENAETSAIGRALACFGLGGSEFASANEVQAAMAQQNQMAPPDKVAAINAFLKEGMLQPAHLEQRFGHSDPSKLLEVEADRVINGVMQAQSQE